MLERLGTTDRREWLVFACLVVLVAITPAGREATDPIVLGLYRTLLLGIIVAYVAWTDRTRLQRLCPYFLATLSALVVVMAVSVLLRPGSHFEGFYAFYEKALFIGAFVALAHASPGRTVEWKGAVLGAVVLIDIGYLTGAMLMGRPLLGPFVNPNYLASFLLPGIAVCAATVSLSRSLKTRVLAGLAGLFLFFGIVQTVSRGATLAGLVMLSMAGWRAARRYGVSPLRLVVAGSLLLAVALAANPALMRKFLDRGERDPHNYQRTQIWMGTLAMIQEHPIAGIGLRHYYYVAKRFTPAVQGTIARYRKWPNIAHSEYLQFAAEMGIPVALVFFGLGGYLVLLNWRRAAKAQPEASVFHEASLLTAIGLGGHALVDNNWTIPVLAAGLVVISQADLLPYRGEAVRRDWSPVAVAAAGLLFVMVWLDSAIIPAVGLGFNEAGHRAYVAGDFKGAELHHRFALGILPRHPVLLDNLGMVYFDEFKRTKKADHLDRAESLFSQSMAENVHFDTPAQHLEKALIERLTGDLRRDQPVHGRIIEATRHILQTNPFNPFIRKNLAEALYFSGERTEAYRELLKAIENEPNYVPAYLRLSEWYKQDGRDHESEQYKKRAIEVVAFYRNTTTEDMFEDLLLGRPIKESAGVDKP